MRRDIVGLPGFEFHACQFFPTGYVIREGEKCPKCDTKNKDEISFKDRLIQIDSEIDVAEHRLFSLKRERKMLVREYEAKYSAVSAKMVNALSEEIRQLTHSHTKKYVLVALEVNESTLNAWLNQYPRERRRMRKQVWLDMAYKVASARAEIDSLGKRLEWVKLWLGKN